MEAKKMRRKKSERRRAEANRPLLSGIGRRRQNLRRGARSQEPRDGRHPRGHRGPDPPGYDEPEKCSGGGRRDHGPRRQKHGAFGQLGRFRKIQQRLQRIFHPSLPRPHHSRQRPFRRYPGGNRRDRRTLARVSDTRQIKIGKISLNGAFMS